METDTSRLLRRADRFQVVLIGEGLLIGGIAGFVVLLYRMALEYAGKIGAISMGPGGEAQIDYEDFGKKNVSFRGWSESW